MSDVKYDPEQCERLAHRIREAAADDPDSQWLVENAEDMADQLEAARREIELMRPVVEAAEGYVRGPNSIGSVIDAVDAYRDARDKP